MVAEIAVSPRADARRASILRIAQAVFLEQGYAAASMSAIAARVGGSKGTLYNYFRSKEELFAAFLSEECEANTAYAFDFSGYDGDLGAAMHQVGTRFLGFVLSDRVMAVHRLVVAECERFPEIGRAFYDNGPRRSIELLAAFLEGEMGAGRVRRADPARAAEQFLSLAKSMLHQRRLWGVAPAPSEAEIAGTVDEALDVWLRAYALESAVPVAHPAAKE